jgi:hypothetical protein
MDADRATCVAVVGVLHLADDNMAVTADSAPPTTQLPWQTTPDEYRP